MRVDMAAPTAASLLKKLFYHSPVIVSRLPPKLSHLRGCGCMTNFSTTTKKKNKYKQKSTSSNTTGTSNRRLVESVVKRRTRSEKEFDEEKVLKFGDSGSHIPVMLGEVLEVFASLQLRSFVDCTLGAAGHSSAQYETPRKTGDYRSHDGKRGNLLCTFCKGTYHNSSSSVPYQGANAVVNSSYGTHSSSTQDLTEHQLQQVMKYLKFDGESNLSDAKLAGNSKREVRQIKQ